MCYTEWHNCGTVGCVLCTTWSDTDGCVLCAIWSGKNCRTAGCVLCATQSATNAGLLGMVRRTATRIQVPASNVQKTHEYYKKYWMLVM